MISHAILTHNRGGGAGTADGIVITPSHNPPPDGGFKYNPPNGGPADTDVTGWIEREANALLGSDIRRDADPRPRERDYVVAYVDDLPAVIDLDLIRESGLKLGVDPLGGASAPYWDAIAERHELDLEVVNDALDPTFRFVPLDWDGKVRMDSSSPYAMSRLPISRSVRRRRRQRSRRRPPRGRPPGAACSTPTLTSRPRRVPFRRHRDWGPDVGIGKRSSLELIDRVPPTSAPPVRGPGRLQVVRERAARRHAGVRGEDSAGARSCARRHGCEHRQDGLIPCCGAGDEARTGETRGGLRRPDEPLRRGRVPARSDVAATPEHEDLLKRSPPSRCAAAAGGRADHRQATTAPGNDAPIAAECRAASGWFAARPSGTE